MDLLKPVLVLSRRSEVLVPGMLLNEDRVVLPIWLVAALLDVILRVLELSASKSRVLSWVKGMKGSIEIKLRLEDDCRRMEKYQVSVAETYCPDEVS